MKSVYWLLLILLIVDCYWFANGTNATITPEELEYEITEGDGMVSICLNVTADSNTNETFEITVDTNANNTMGVKAMMGSDFNITGSPLTGTVTNNGPLLCFDLNITDDDAAEGTEYINITLSTNSSSILIDEPNIIVTIIDNNVITATVNNTVTIMEGLTVDVCVTFMVPPEGLGNAIEVYGNITNQSTEDNDYIISGLPLTFAPAMSPLPVCISINAINDSTPEGEEMFVITWTASSSIVTFVPTTTTVIIEGHLTPSLLNSTDITGTEGDTIQLCIGLYGPTTVLLNYPFTVTPNTPGYTITDGASGNLTIEPNNQTGCIMIEFVDDMTVEETEMFTVSFTTINMSSSINITDDDILRLTVPDSITVNESIGCTTIQLTQMDTSLTVNVPILINITTTACDGCDFTISPSNLTQVNDTITVCIIMDNLVEGTESFLIEWIIDSTVTPSNVILDNNQTNITIIDTTYATIGFTKANVSVEESTDMYTPQIEVTSANITIVTGFYISVTYMNGTAIAGQDFLFVDNDPIYWNGSVLLINNVTIIENEIVECNESLTLSLTVISNGLNINTSISKQEITIIDNDQSIIMTPDTLTYSESIRNAQLCFDHTEQIAPKSDNSNYTLSFNTTDVSATVGDDYTLSTNTVVIPLLRSNQICINIDIDDDAVVEDPETFEINWFLEPLLLPDIILMNSVTTVTITDNDVPSSSATPSSTVASTSSSAGLLGTYAIIGIIVGVVAAGVCFLLVLICVICCVKIRMNRQGFYPTNEDKGEAPQMLRYSASLRSLQSQTVMPADPRDKENEYMV